MSPPSAVSHEGQAEQKRPFALVESGVRGTLIVCANRTAAQQGIRAGLALPDARARVPGLETEPVDRAADAAALNRLGHWAIRWTPLVEAKTGAHGLLLDITGCAHLHGGEEGMMAVVTRALRAQGIPHRLGLAGTPGAAIALTVRGESMRQGPAIAPPGQEREALADLPMKGLRLPAACLDLLRRFGLNRIGQLYGIDRKALACRFRSKERAAIVVRRLDQALGLVREPLVPLRPEPLVAARLPCPQPLIDPAGVSAGLEQLLGHLCAQLTAKGRGAQSFTLHAYRADGTHSCLTISTARPERSAKRLDRLFRERIEQIDPGYGIDLLELVAHRAGTLSTAPAPLSADLAGNPLDIDALSALSDRLSAKLGDQSVSIKTYAESHIPERAETETPFAGSFPAPPREALKRPLRLLRQPEPLNVLAGVPDGPPVQMTWRRVPRRITKAVGPERLSPEWWKLTEAKARARDYYHLEDEEGRRYWVYRDGLYNDGRGTTPQWYLHGLDS